MWDTLTCWRVSPSQKEEVVKLIKLQAQAFHGANDVCMMLEAHVGIGLYGEAGMQASDYAIGEFRFCGTCCLSTAGGTISGRVR